MQEALSCPLQALFQAAVDDATQSGQRMLWYPHAWLFGYLTSKAELLTDMATADDSALLRSKSEQLHMAALDMARGGCADVLRSYRHAACSRRDLCCTGLHILSLPLQLHEP